MDMKKKTEIIKSVAVSVTLLFGVWLMSGCKPTEQGYRAAYDAARQKREAAAAEMMIPVSGLLSDDGPQRRIIDGDTLFVTKERVRGADGENLPRWLLAVGVYRMDTNARAQAASLRGSAMAVRGEGDRWYCVADTASGLDGIMAARKRFMASHPDFPYIGLPASPVIVNAM